MEMKNAIIIILDPITRVSKFILLINLFSYKLFISILNILHYFILYIKKISII